MVFDSGIDPRTYFLGQGNQYFALSVRARDVQHIDSTGRLNFRHRPNFLRSSAPKRRGNPAIPTNNRHAGEAARVPPTESGYGVHAGGKRCRWNRFPELQDNPALVRPGALHADGPRSLAGNLQKCRFETFQARGKIGQYFRRNFSLASLGRTIRAMVKNWVSWPNSLFPSGAPAA